MENQQKWMKNSLSFGYWLYNIFLLQVLPILYSLKGLIFLGIFPSIASSFHVFYQLFIEKRFDLSVQVEFKNFYQRYFWQTNKLGYILAGMASILFIDLYISSHYIQSLILHLFLLLLTGIYLVVASYLFTVFSRYDYQKLRNYFKQSFFIGLSCPVQSVAILLALVVVSYIFYYIPFILVFFGLPVTFGAVSWFASQGILKAEQLSMDSKS